MSDTFTKSLESVVNVAIDACINIVRASHTIDPADSHDELKEVIIRNISVLKVDSDDKPVKLPQ